MKIQIELNENNGKKGRDKTDFGRKTNQVYKEIYI